MNLFDQSSGCSKNFLSSMDPRVKVVSLCLFAVVVALSQQMFVLLVALALGMLAVFTVRPGFKTLLYRMGPANLFLFFWWVLIAFSQHDEPVFSFGPLAWTHEGIAGWLCTTIRTNSILLMLIALTTSTSVLTIGHALHQLGFSKKLVHLIFFTFRYIHVIHREYSRLLVALKARGFRAKTDAHTYRTLACLAAMILVRSFDRAQRVQNAMLCRGYCGELYSLHGSSLRATDVMAFVAMCATVTALGVMEWTKVAW